MSQNSTSQTEIKFPVKSSSFKSGTEEANETSNVKKCSSRCIEQERRVFLLGSTNPKSDETPREITPR